MRPLLLAATLILSLLGIVSRADAAPIDCTDQSSDLVPLFCDDPYLAKLNEALGDTENDPSLKAWLADARKRCRFAASGSIPEAAVWTAVPCVIVAYQAKIKAVQGKLPDELAARTGLDIPVVHPLCVKLAATPEKADADRAADALVPVRDCNRRFSHLDIDSSDNMLTSEAPGESGMSSPFFGYEVIGRLAEGTTLLRLEESTGGTGRFSSITFIDKWPATGSVPLADPRLAFRSLGTLAFGDRCNGGLTEAKLVNPTTIELTANITPADLFTFEVTSALKRNPKTGHYEVVEIPSTETRPDRVKALEPYEDLDAAAASCLGTATIAFDLKAATARLASITVEEISGDAEWVKRLRQQPCFNKVVGDALAPLPKTLKPAEVAALAVRFEQACLK